MKLSSFFTQKNRAKNRPLLVISGRTFKVIPQPLPGQEIPSRCPHLAMAEPLLDSSDRSAVGVAERGEGVSKQMGGDFGHYASFPANLGKGLFSVGAAHRLPAAPVADEEVSMARVTGRDWNERPVFCPEFQVAVGGFAHRNLSLFIALSPVHKNYPIFKIKIGHADVNSLGNPKSTVQHHRVKRQIADIPPTPPGIRFLFGGNNLFNLSFQVDHKPVENFRERRPWQIAGAARRANLVQGVVINKPASVGKLDEISQNGVVGVDCVLFIVLPVVMVNKGRDAFRGWRPVAKLLVNAQDAPVLPQSVRCNCRTSLNEASYSTV